jgi:hypothetical protein
MRPTSWKLSISFLTMPRKLGKVPGIEEYQHRREDLTTMTEVISQERMYRDNYEHDRPNTYMHTFYGVSITMVNLMVSNLIDKSRRDRNTKCITIYPVDGNSTEVDVAVTYYYNLPEDGDVTLAKGN